MAESGYNSLACENNYTVYRSGMGESGRGSRATAINRRRQAGATTGNPKIDFQSCFCIYPE